MSFRISSRTDTIRYIHLLFGFGVGSLDFCIGSIPGYRSWFAISLAVSPCWKPIMRSSMSCYSFVSVSANFRPRFLALFRGQKLRVRQVCWHAESYTYLLLSYIARAYDFTFKMVTKTADRRCWCALNYELIKRIALPTALLDIKILTGFDVRQLYRFVRWKLSPLIGRTPPRSCQGITELSSHDASLCVVTAPFVLPAATD